MITIEDFYKLVFLSDLEAYGSDIYFVKTVPSKNKNDYESTIWIKGKKSKQLTAGPNDRSPKISQDGKYMAFVAKRKENKFQLMLLPMCGGEPIAILEREDITNIRWSHDSRYIYFISNEIKKEEDDLRIIEKYPFYFNGNGFTYNKRPTLFKVNLKGKVEKLTYEPFNVFAYALGPTENKIAIVMSIDGQQNSWNNLYFLTGKKLEKYNAEGYFYDLAYSPDGKKIALVYSDNKKSISQHKKLYLLVENELTCLNKEMDRSIGNSLNSDSIYGTGKIIEWYRDNIYFLITDQGSTKIYKYDLSDKKAYYILGENDSIDDFVVQDGTIYLIMQRINYPQELYVYDGIEKKLTNFNRHFNDLPIPEKLNVLSSDGKNIDGWILKNNNGTILTIHGGPKSAYGHAFNFEFYYLYSAGFSVLFSNPRGSDSYDESYSLEIRGRYGQRDYKDLMEFFETAVKKYNLSKSAGVIGGSYGGFMVNWVVTQTNIFKAAVTDRSISNWISDFGTSDIGLSFDVDQIGGVPFEDLELYWAQSPLKYVKNIKTPMLILHAEEDYRCSIEQAYQLYSALKYLNREAKLVTFPGENHTLPVFGKPLHRVRRLLLIRDWFEEHLQK
ncbi:MAG: alpha/beta fold hydrolase [Thermoplasmata archaeon]